MVRTTRPVAGTDAPGVAVTRDAALTILLACLHLDPQRLDAGALSDLDEEDWRRLLALAAAHGVRPLIGQRLADSQLAPHVPSDVQRTLREAARQAAGRMLRVQVQLAELATALTAESIPVIVLKGAYLAHIVYPSLALRDMQDIDLLVPREHLDRVTAVALARGYTPLRPFLVEQEAAAMHHITRLKKPDALSIEIHWNITTPNQIYSIDPTILWTHAVPVQIAGSRMLGLSAEHLLLHLCAHVSYQHGFEFGIRSLVDIATAIRRFDGELDWQFVEHQCRAWSWQRGVHLPLYLARDLLGAAVPNDLLDSLAGNTDRHVIDAARVQILGEPHGSTKGHHFERLRTLPGLRAKARHVWGRIFLPRSEIARLYARTPGLAGVVVLYLVRVCGLANRYFRRAVGLLQKQPAVAEASERRQRIRRWLSEG